jgi:hypothetical protein
MQGIEQLESLPAEGMPDELDHGLGGTVRALLVTDAVRLGDTRDRDSGAVRHGYSSFGHRTGSHRATRAMYGIIQNSHQIWGMELAFGEPVPVHSFWGSSVTDIGILVRGARSPKHIAQAPDTRKVHAMSELEQPTPSGISRRTVTKAMAWAVPVVAVAAPVPAFAGASQGTVTLTGEACKLPGNSSAPYDTNGAVYLFRVTNTTVNPGSVTFAKPSRSGSNNTNVVFSIVRISGSGTCCTLLGDAITVAPNSNDLFALVTGGWDNSSNGTLTLPYAVGGVNQTPATTTPNSLEPVTPGGANCNIGGSCVIDDDISRCYLQAVGVAGCTSGCVPV